MLGHTRMVGELTSAVYYSTIKPELAALKHGLLIVKFQV